MSIMTPTEFRKDVFNAIKKVNSDGEPLIIHGKIEDNSAVLLSLDDWNSIQETLLFFSNKNNADTLKEREDDVEVAYGEDIWDTL